MSRKTRPLLAMLALVVPALLVARPGLGASDPQVGGRELFRQNCSGCHLEGGFGTRVLARRVAQGQATLEAREELDPDYIKLVVRRGIGSMPQIRRTELSDQDLDAIAHYLEAGE